jgi:hypothetical protein
MSPTMNLYLMSQAALCRKLPAAGPNALNALSGEGDLFDRN